MSKTEININEGLRSGEILIISKTEIAEIAMRAVELYKQQEIERIAAEAQAAIEANSKKFYTEKEVIEMTGLSHATLWRYAKPDSGILVPVKKGKRNFYKREDVELYMKK